MLEVQQMESFPPGENPYWHDAYRMGMRLGTNVEVMFEKFEHEVQPYLVIVNKVTGERIRIVLDNSIHTLA